MTSRALDPRFRDFDRAFAAIDGPAPLTMRLFGEEWELPPDPPARAMFQRKRAATALRAIIDAQQARDDGDDDAEAELMEQIVELGADIEGLDIYRHACDLVGEDNLTAWLDRGLKWTRVHVILDWVESEHDGRISPTVEDDGGGDPEADAPDGGDPDPAPDVDPAGTTSSNDGEPSSPTSSGSTAAT